MIPSSVVPLGTGTSYHIRCEGQIHIGCCRSPARRIKHLAFAFPLLKIPCRACLSPLIRSPFQKIETLQ